MISIVVCSVKQPLFNQFCKNVEVTIGVPYEIIQIDNKAGNFNICSAYNKGAAIAKYPIICFSHEDILFETNNWGKVLMDTFDDKSVGLIGVLGICYLSLFPANWLNSQEYEGQLRVGALENNPIHTHTRFPGSATAEVVAIDGMFMATRKQIMNTLHFDTDIFDDFHGYDGDISMQIRQLNYKVVITRNLILFHLSGGNFNDAYYKAIENLRRKWRRHLPAYVPAYSAKEITDLKVKSLIVYFQNKGQPMSINKKLAGIKYAAEKGVLLDFLQKFFKQRIKSLFNERRV